MQDLWRKLLMALECLCSFVAGEAVVTAWRGVPLALGMACGLLAVAATYHVQRRHLEDSSGEAAPAPLFPGWWPLLLLLFMIPVYTYRVPPGADSAMYAAIARALGDGSAVLNPAWGDVYPAVYPRGYPAFIASLATVLGYARASVLAACLCYAMFWVGGSHFLKSARGLASPYRPAAAGWALVVLLMAASPQCMFRWGGDCTCAATGIGLYGMSLALTHRGSATLFLSALLFMGATVTHPIGTIVALFASAWLLTAELAALTDPTERKLILKRVAVAAGVWVIWAALLQACGPPISTSEAAWIRNFQRKDTGAFSGTLTNLLPEVWGWARFTAGFFLLGLFCAAVPLLLKFCPDGRRVLMRTLLWLCSLLALTYFGPDIPRLGYLVYPARFLPLVPLAMVVVIAAVVESLYQRKAALRGVILLALLVLSCPYHIVGFQSAPVTMTRNDEAVLRWARDNLPPGAMVAGRYGDATQWFPALTGHPITKPHLHATLFDEVQPWLNAHFASYAFVGESCFTDEPPIQDFLLQKPPLVTVGRAGLYRLLVPLAGKRDW